MCCQCGPLQVIVALPGEFSTMAGRRIQRAVYETLRGRLGPQHQGRAGHPHQHLTRSYVTTHEEYQVQRYRGASTLYGPHTLDAYIYTAVAAGRGHACRPAGERHRVPEDFSSKLIEPGAAGGAGHGANRVELRLRLQAAW